MNETSEPVAPREPPAKRRGRGRVRVGAVLALAVAAGVLAWVVIGRSDKTASQTATGNTAQTTSTVSHVGPLSLSATRLSSVVATLKQPVYWSGPQPGYTYELTRTSNGKVYVRYLPAGVKAGDPRATFLIVATYPFPNAMKALKAVAHGKGTTLPGGGFALPDTSYPKSVHLAFPGVAYQVEVYDPSPRQARQVALSGNVQPVP